MGDAGRYGLVSQVKKARKSDGGYFASHFHSQGSYIQDFYIFSLNSGGGGFLFCVLTGSLIFYSNGRAAGARHVCSLLLEMHQFERVFTRMNFSSLGEWKYHRI